MICSIHPFPGIDLFFNHSFPITNYINYKRNHSLHHLSDHFSPYLLLILPMLGRLYLALRALLLHSRMFNDAGSRSIGAFNKVSNSFIMNSLFHDSLKYLYSIEWFKLWMRMVTEVLLTSILHYVCC
ncbi:unnamed protein product [Schistosoma margrebowiei]|uniref:Uncharacterized protein n=1 Tax=Schistosoma margrebowiei TaxID=48269 RepID=A0A3P8BEG6_9TREM|nr:unnamed protein product [Schistosoma margrebowiei]